MTLTSKIPENSCPGCMYTMNRASDIAADALPRAGDPSICLNCGRILVFNSDLSLQSPTAEEISELMSDHDAWGKIELYQRAIRARGPMHT